jgi:hypothetical protein
VLLRPDAVELAGTVVRPVRKDWSDLLEEMVDLGPNSELREERRTQTHIGDVFLGGAAVGLGQR